MEAIAESYPNDIFISYSHLDNEPFSEEDNFQWISEFHQNLSSRLSKYLGERPNIWRDNKGLRQNDDFTAEIHDNLPKSAVLVSILSPRYVRSEWCTRELSEFVKHAETNGGIKVKNKFRVFKVLKTPLGPADEFPPEVRDATGYSFYKIDQNDRIREFDRSMYPETKTDYYLILDDLAQDIRQMLDEMRTLEAEEVTPISEDKPKVYLALPPPDLSEYYQTVKRELSAQGYDVLPHQEFNGSMTERKMAIAEELGKADLSLHLFGEFYDAMARLQNQLAAEASQETGMPRFVWIPKAILDQAHDETDDLMDPPQRDFLFKWQNEESLQMGAELMTGTIETFKNNALKRLEKIEEERKATTPTLEKPLMVAETMEPSVRYVYVVCQKEDKAGAKQLKKMLDGMGYEVRLSRWEKDGSLQKEYHEKALLSNESVLVYWGEGDEYWAEDLIDDLNDFLEEHSSERKMPLKARGIVLAAPEDEDKLDFSSGSFHIMNGMEEITEATLQPFLDDLNATEA
ncbi:MAG TPA: hypothetical protein DCR93_02310 [Cytophagales bacterium]|nr:hypothetical protein [Cytophagales bacterium]HAP58383.1 hypothetical protein [Cytophagales bacterium]